MPSPAHVGTADVGNFMLRRPSVFPRRHLEDSSPRRLLLSGSPALKIPVPNSLLGGNPVRQSQQLAGPNALIRPLCCPIGEVASTYQIFDGALRFYSVDALTAAVFAGLLPSFKRVDLHQSGYLKSEERAT